MVKGEKKIGKAKTVLIFNQGNRQTGVISSVVVRIIRPTKVGKRLRFTGPTTVSDKVKRHIEETVMVIVDRTLESLQLPRQNYEISFTNLSAASANDIGLNISGFSADLPILLAMLSAALQLPIPDDIVTTGHIASVAGDITAVKSIPAKIEAAVADVSVRLFICPDLNQDKSLGTLSPGEHQRSFEAIMAAKNIMRIRQVFAVSELVKLVFAEEAIALTSLRLGFYDAIGRPTESQNCADEVAHYFSQGNEQRFWVALERLLLTGNVDRAKELLESFARFHIVRKQYVNLLGQKLQQLLYSLPPATRRLNISFPLLVTSLCIKLSQFAGEHDYEDVCVLFEAAHGRFTATEPIIPEPTTQDQSLPEADSRVFDTVIGMISESALAQKLHIPIDSARSSFILEKSTVASWEEFDKTVVAFYIHLQRYLSPNAIESLDHQEAKTKALALLERTFRNHGGHQQALAQSIDGTRGGLHSVLNIITEQFKSEQQANYIQRVFTDALSPLDWDGRVDFMRAALGRLAPCLPDEIRTQSPERFAHDYEVIVQTFVQSLDKVNQLFRTF